MRNHSGQPIMDKQPTAMANSSFRMKSVQQSRTQRGSSSRPIADRDPATAEYAPGRSTSAWHSHKWNFAWNFSTHALHSMYLLVPRSRVCIYAYVNIWCMYGINLMFYKYYVDMINTLLFCNYYVSTCFNLSLYVCCL